MKASFEEMWNFLILKGELLSRPTYAVICLLNLALWAGSLQIFLTIPCWDGHLMTKLELDQPELHQQQKQATSLSPISDLLSYQVEFITANLTAWSSWQHIKKIV